MSRAGQMKKGDLMYRATCGKLLITTRMTGKRGKCWDQPDAAGQTLNYKIRRRKCSTLCRLLGMRCSQEIRMLPKLQIDVNNHAVY